MANETTGPLIIQYILKILKLKFKYYQLKAYFIEMRHSTYFIEMRHSTKHRVLLAYYSIMTNQVT